MVCPVNYPIYVIWLSYARAILGKIHCSAFSFCEGLPIIGLTLFTIQWYLTNWVIILTQRVNVIRAVELIFGQFLFTSMFNGVSYPTIFYQLVKPFICHDLSSVSLFMLWGSLFRPSWYMCVFCCLHPFCVTFCFMYLFVSVVLPGYEDISNNFNSKINGALTALWQKRCARQI